MKIHFGLGPLEAVFLNIQTKIQLCVFAILSYYQLRKVKMMNIPVILSGGSGTRLWPLSRLCHPKQLLEFDGNYSLLQNTLKRIASIKNLTKPIIVCNEEHRFTIIEQIKEINCDIEALIIEPRGRNTAPSIALASLYSMEIDPNPCLFIFPSDHYIENEAEFCSNCSNN